MSVKDKRSELYVDVKTKGLYINTESFTGTVKDFDIAKKIVQMLLDKGELPLESWDFVQREIWAVAIELLTK